MPVYSYSIPKKKAAQFGNFQPVPSNRHLPAGVLSGTFVEPPVTTSCLACGSWERRCITKICPVERNLLMVQEAMLDRKGRKVTNVVEPKKDYVATKLISVPVGANYHCRSCGMLNKYDPCQVCEYEEANGGKSPPMPLPAVENFMAIVTTDLKYASRANNCVL